MKFVWEYVSPGVWLCNEGSGTCSGLVKPGERGNYLASVSRNGSQISEPLSFSSLEGAKLAVNIQLEKMGA